MEQQLTPLFHSLPNLSQLLMHAAEYPCTPGLVWRLPALTNIHWVSCSQLPRLECPKLRSLTISRWDGIAQQPLDVNLNTLLTTPSLTSLMIGLPLQPPMTSIRWDAWPLLSILRLDETNELNQVIISSLCDACPFMEVISVAVPHVFVTHEGWLTNMLQRWPKLHTIEIRVPVLSPAIARKTTARRPSRSHDDDDDDQVCEKTKNSPETKCTESSAANTCRVTCESKESECNGASSECTSSTSSCSSDSKRAVTTPTVAASSNDRIVHSSLTSITVDRIDEQFFRLYSCPYLNRLAVSDAESLPMDLLLTFIHHCPRMRSLAMLGMAPSIASPFATKLTLPPITLFHTQSHAIMPAASVRAIITALRASLTDITIDFATASILAVLATEPLLSPPPAGNGINYIKQLNISATTMTTRDLDVFIALIARFTQLSIVRVPGDFAMPLSDAIASSPLLKGRTIPCKVVDWDVDI
jgi:hypothetical protein